MNIVCTTCGKKATVINKWEYISFGYEISVQMCSECGKILVDGHDYQRLFNGLTIEEYLEKEG